MKSTILWGILCLVILSTATIQLSDDVTSSQFKTLIFFTLLFILYYLTLALGIIKTGQLRLSGLISFGFLVFLGFIYVLSDYEFTYFMYPIIIIALILYLASGILFIIALKDFFQKTIQDNPNLNRYKTQILVSLCISVSVIVVLAMIPSMRNSAIAIGLFAVFLVVLFAINNNRVDYNANIIVLTCCFIISVVIININMSGLDFTETRIHQLLGLVILALSWGWSSNRILRRFFKESVEYASYFVFLAFAFAALGFYQVLIMEKGLNEAWKDIISYRNILLLLGIFIGWLIAFRSEKKHPLSGI